MRIPTGNASIKARPNQGGDFHLATTGDLHLATSGDFLMATDKTGARHRQADHPEGA